MLPQPVFYEIIGVHFRSAANQQQAPYLNGVIPGAPVSPKLLESKQPITPTGVSQPNVAL